MSKRIFVFRGKTSNKYERPFLYAIREDEIFELKSQLGSQHVYLQVNGIEMDASFEEVVNKLGERIDIFPYGQTNPN